MISVCFLFFKIPLPRGGSYPSIVIPTGAKHRVQSPLESTDRPEMESRPYEFLLQWDLKAIVMGLVAGLSLANHSNSSGLPGAAHLLQPRGMPVRILGGVQTRAVCF